METRDELPSPPPPRSPASATEAARAMRRTSIDAEQHARRLQHDPLDRSASSPFWNHSPKPSPSPQKGSSHHSADQDSGRSAVAHDIEMLRPPESGEDDPTESEDSRTKSKGWGWGWRRGRKGAKSDSVGLDGDPKAAGQGMDAHSLSLDGHASGAAGGAEGRGSSAALGRSDGPDRQQRQVDVPDAAAHVC